MGTVTIGGNTYNILGTSAGADAYLAADPLYYEAWALYTSTEKARQLVKGTRKMASLSYQGTKTSSSQALPWPRTGVVDEDGVAVDPNVTPAVIEEATYLLAAMVGADPEALDEDSEQAGNIKRAKAGPLEVEYHERLAAKDVPAPVLEMIRPYLSSGPTRAGGIGGYSSGTLIDHPFDDDFGLGVQGYVPEDSE